MAPACRLALLLVVLALVAPRVASESDAGIDGHCIDASASDSGFIFCERPDSSYPSCTKALAYYHSPLPGTPPPPLLPVRFAESALDFLLALEVYRTLGGVVNNLQRVAVLLNAFISLTPADQLELVLHGDDDSIADIRDALQLPPEFTLDVNNPPRQLLARLLGFLILPDHLGSALSTMLLEDSARFGINPNTTLWFVEAFYNYIWEHASVEMAQRRVIHRVLPWDHAQYIAATTAHSSCGIGRRPVRPITFAGSLFGHYDAEEDDRRLRNLADFFSVQIGAPKGSKDAILSRTRALAASVTAAALPVAYGWSREAEALSVLSTGTAAGAALARTYAGGDAGSFYGDASLAFWLMIGAGGALVTAALAIGVVIAVRARRESAMQRTVERVAAQSDDLGRRVGRNEGELQDVSSGLQSAQHRISEVDASVRALESAVQQEFVRLYSQMGLRREHAPLAQHTPGREQATSDPYRQRPLALSGLASQDYAPAQGPGRITGTRDSGSGSPRGGGGGFFSGLFGGRARAPQAQGEGADYASIL